MVQNLAVFEVGVPRLVFYGTSPNHQFDNRLGRVLEDPRLEFITKFVITGETRLDNEQLPARPSLLVIQGEVVSSKHQQLFDQLEVFDPDTKVIVLVDVYSESFVVYKAFLSEYLFFSNVIFLDEENTWTVSFKIWEITPLNYFPNAEELINRSHRQNIQGRPITYSQRSPLSAGYPSMRWLQETSLYLNTTVREVPHSCS